MGERSDLQPCGRLRLVGVSGGCSQGVGPRHRASKSPSKCLGWHIWQQAWKKRSQIEISHLSSRSHSATESNEDAIAQGTCGEFPLRCFRSWAFKSHCFGYGRRRGVVCPSCRTRGSRGGGRSHEIIQMLASSKYLFVPVPIKSSNHTSIRKLGEWLTPRR